MNENEIERIAAATNALRPDWPVASVRTLIATRLAARTRRDVAVALTWVACDSESKTPARVLEAGPWWKAVTTEGIIVLQPPCRDQECKLHPGEYADSCRGCASDRLTGERTTPAEYRRPDRESHLARARAEVQAAKARMCSHGVDRSRATCNENHDDPPPPGPVERDGTPPRADHPATPPDHDTAPSAEEETSDA